MGWLPQDWKKIILSIEAKITSEEGESFIPVGTAFVIDYKTINILVTVRHILESDNKNSLFISFNTKDDQIGRVCLSELASPEDGVDWFIAQDPRIDIAIIPFRIDFDKWDVNKLSMDMFESIDNLNEGDDIFFLGFPLGIKNLEKVNPLARSGIIARKNNDGTLIIDAHVFPGNSGSPVFLRPSIVEFSPTGINIGKITPPKLIGLISGFLPYIDPCVSLQTNRQRITFEENSGLGNVFSLDYIINLIKSEEVQKCLTNLIAKTKENKNMANVVGGENKSDSPPHTSCSAHIKQVKRLC